MTRDFWEMGDLPAEEPEEHLPAIDRLTDSGVTVRGRPLEEVLRPAYEAFAEM